MKYLLIFIFSFSILNAQNFDADTLHFFYGNEPNTPRQLSPNYDEFQTNKFLRGFHWSSDSLIDKLMGLNIHVGGSTLQYTSPNSYCDSTYIIRKTYNIGANGSERTPLQAQAMQFDARLKIDPTKDFNYLENDNLQSIFGFINVKGRRVGDYQVFEKDSDYVNNGFVLSDNWPSVELEHTCSSFKINKIC